MKDTTRTKALGQLTTDSNIKSILDTYPTVKPIVEEARNYKPVHGYHRISLYYHHKARILQIVPEPQAGFIYGLIGDILPMDASDKDTDEPCISGTW